MNPNLEFLTFLGGAWEYPNTMNVPSFSRFRSDTPAPFPSGEKVSYSEIQKSGLQEHYIRIIHKLIAQGEVTKAQVDGWLRRAASGDRAEGRKVRDELEATQPAPVAAATSTSGGTGAATPRGGGATGTRRGRAEKLLTLVSKGNHKEAVKTAKTYDLSPTKVAQTALRPGQSAEAHTVRAPTKVASKLITTGYWATQ